MLPPPPVVVDADVLLRNVDYAVRNGYVGALTRNASSRYSMMSGVVLFASAEAGKEVARHLPDIAKRRSVDIEEVHRVWNDSFAPRIRFVVVPEGAVADPRIDGTDAKDQHTARLACLLAPAVLATDNRKHFRPFGLADTKTDAVAIDLASLGQFVTHAKGAAAIPALTWSLTIDGSRKIVAKVGRGDALLIAAVLIGAFVLFVQSERGRAVRAKIGGVAELAAPRLFELIAETEAASDRVQAFAIDRVIEPDPVTLLARRLATEKQLMTTTDVADWLRAQHFVFQGERRHLTETRAWMARTPCFDEVARGQWALGHHGFCVTTH